MKQKAPILRFYALVACLFIIFTSAQLVDSKEEWKEVTHQDAVKISYIYQSNNPEAPTIELNFVNQNDFGVNVTWQNQILFKNDPAISRSQEKHHIYLAPNSDSNSYEIELSQISTLQATLVVEDFTVFNLEISKN